VIAVGSHYKSNGFFFHEPSDFSFVMALGLVVEWVGQKRPLRLGCHALALLLTYSGTGLFALAIGLLFPLGLKTLLRLSAGLLRRQPSALASWRHESPRRRGISGTTAMPGSAGRVGMSCGLSAAGMSEYRAHRDTRIA